MNQREYSAIEDFMLSQMTDTAHDNHHIYRVLHSALDISASEKSVDMDILLASCLLHDVRRERQLQNQNLCHAEIGGKMAYAFLGSRKWDTKKALHVQSCISSHRYRGNNPPESLEAKILFDADKLDAAGALGIARTLIYEGQVSEPLYDLNESGGIVTDNGGAEISSFFQEYNYKLKKVYAAFYTARAKEIALGRQKTAAAFYAGLYDEVSSNYLRGNALLAAVLE